MRQLVLFIFLILSFAGYSQVGITTENPLVTPNSAAELDVVSKNNNTGVIVPRFTDADITGGKITNPTNGLLIYNRTKKKFMYNAGSPATPLWTFVGSIPAIENYTILPGIEGEIVYDKLNQKIYYYNGTAWVDLK